MRCHDGNGIGNKAKYCWNTMRRLTYNSAKKTNKDSGENDEKIDAKKQVWMKKNSVLNMTEIKDRCTSEDGFHMEIHS